MRRCSRVSGGPESIASASACSRFGMTSCGAWGACIRRSARSDAVAVARAAGFDNISLDLMMWLPGQDLADWLESVEHAIAIGPDHLSLYMLEVYPHPPLKQEIDARRLVAGARRRRRGDVLDRHGAARRRRLPAIRNLQRRAARAAIAAQPEVLVRWRVAGVRPGAHSTLNGNRWRNVSGTDDYIRRISAGTTVVVERRVLSNDEHLSDALFTGLRLNEGIELSILSARFGTDIWGRYGDRLVPFQEAGLLLHEGDRLRLTRPGMLLANEVMAVFV